MHAPMIEHRIAGGVFARTLRKAYQPPRWLRLLLFRRAVARAFRRFELSYARFAHSLFDHYFLITRAAPLLERALAPGGMPSAEELAGAWFGQLGPTAELRLAHQHQEIVHVAAAFLAALDAELARSALFSAAGGTNDQRAGLGASEGAASSQAIAASLADTLFAEALREDSNRELDWLWLAASRSDPRERAYCLERALLINPESVARAELRRIER
jgi:uncharacterized protein YeaO (DUF488 family)